MEATSDLRWWRKKADLLVSTTETVIAMDIVVAPSNYDSNVHMRIPIIVTAESHGGTYSQQMHYHADFMRTQNIASYFADKFKEAMSQAKCHFSREDQRTLSRSMPIIQFIEPLVFELMEDGIEKNILVERYLNGDYKKFNSNMGFVDDDVKQLIDRMGNLGLGNDLNDLGAIEEGSEEEDESDDEEIFDSKEAVPENGNYSDLQDEYFPQAFSHFTYEKSKKQLMVVDLQGVFTIKADGTKLYELTDPVIHKRKSNRNRTMKKWSFGRTDRGEKGMQAFFETHKCTQACKILGLKEVDPEDVICHRRWDR